jgi:TPR repeat protein
MSRLFTALIFAGICWLVACGAEAQPIDCDVAVDTANDSWTVSPELIHCVRDGSARAESLLGMIYVSVDTPCLEDDCLPSDPAEYGLDASSTADDRQKEGIRLLRSASAQGQGDAMNEMGIVYLDGTAGMQQDYALAKGWFERATEAGDSYAPYNLARMYLYGRGVDTSEGTAFEYLRMSSKRGYRVATCSLGLLVEHKNLMNQLIGAYVRIVAGMAGKRSCEWYEIMEELR